MIQVLIRDDVVTPVVLFHQILVFGMLLDVTSDERAQRYNCERLRPGIIQPGNRQAGTEALSSQRIGDADMGEDDLPVSQLVFKHSEMASFLDFEASGLRFVFDSQLGGVGHS
jgi:hypothetical protein